MGLLLSECKQRSHGAMRTQSRKWLLEFRDAKILEAQIGGRIVPLNADVPRFELAAGASVIAFWPVVVPVGGLDAVDPGRQVVAVRDDGHAEPFAVFRHLLARG